MKKETLDLMLSAITSTMDMASKTELGDGYCEIRLEKTALNRRFCRMGRVLNETPFDETMEILFRLAKQLEMDIISEKLQGCVRIGAPKIMF